MHVSVATLTALHTAHNLQCSLFWPALFVVAIALSCIFTKQHYLIDLPVGAVFGWFTFYLFLRIM